MVDEQTIERVLDLGYEALALAVEGQLLEAEVCLEQIRLLLTATERGDDQDSC